MHQKDMNLELALEKSTSFNGFPEVKKTLTGILI